MLFENLNLEVMRGQQVALVGESGSGKSTLLNLIAGLDQVSQGRIFIAGRAIAGLDVDACAKLRREQIGFVFQAFHLLPHLDCTQNVALALLLKGATSRVAKEESEHLLVTLGLGQRLRALPSTLSGGEQQRVALARALVHAPALVLADEPTGNLDSRTASEALDLVFKLCADQGSSLLMVTHSDYAASLCSRQLRLQNCGLQTDR